MGKKIHLTEKYSHIHILKVFIIPFFKELSCSLQTLVKLDKNMIPHLRILLQQRFLREHNNNRY